jgi:hypothetical protein
VTDLAEFVLDRIHEDATVARRASTGPWTAKFIGPPEDAFDVIALHDGTEVDIAVDHGSSPKEGAADRPDAEHIALWDPVRVLAECDAKQRIVEHETRSPYEKDFSIRREPADGPILRLLALPYAGHPDYREEWRP